MGDGRRKCDGQRRKAIGRANDDPCSRAPRRKALEVPSIYASRFTRERVPPDPSMINPLVLLEGKDDPSYGPIPRPGMARYMDEALPPSKRLNWRANGTLVPPPRGPMVPLPCAYYCTRATRFFLFFWRKEDPIVTTYLLPRRFFATKSAIMT